MKNVKEIVKRLKNFSDVSSLSEKDAGPGEYKPYTPLK